MSLVVYWLIRLFGCQPTSNFKP